MADFGSHATIGTNLLHVWKMDEASTGNRADSKGSLTLTQQGSPGYTTGIRNNCATLATASTQMFWATNSDWSGSSDFSLSTWVKPADVTSTKGFLCIETYTLDGNPMVLIQQYNASVYLYVNGNYRILTAGLSTSVWAHVVWTYKQSTTTHSFCMSIT